MLISIFLFKVYASRRRNELKLDCLYLAQLRPTVRRIKQVEKDIERDFLVRVRA